MVVKNKRGTVIKDSRKTETNWGFMVKLAFKYGLAGEQAGDHGIKYRKMMAIELADIFHKSPDIWVRLDENEKARVDAILGKGDFVIQ